MNILMIGRGVIAAQYGWAFEKAGHDVEFYVRPGRMAEYGPSIDLDILDGRKRLKGTPVKEKWFIKMREEIRPGHGYDLIIVSVNHDQFHEVAALIGPLAGNATILAFNNAWEDLPAFAEKLPAEQVIWGFPGGGGGYRNKTALEGGFMKSVFLEHELSAASSARHREVVALFRGAGFSLSFQKDMTVWYWVHFILNAGMAAGALKHGSYRNLYSSPRYVKEAILLMRDMLPLVAAKGRRVDSLTRIALGLPAGLTAFAAYKVLSGSSVAAAIMERMESTAYIPKESFAQFPKEVLAEARKLGVALPRLEAFESYWS